VKIEALESIKSDGYVLDAGDVKQNVPDPIGARWCAAGWAKDLDGVVATGERKVLKVELEAHSGALNATVQEVSRG
jgi:hypothetical protein